MRASAGLLLVRTLAGSDEQEVLVAHMAGPYWVRKGDGAWTIPKGEIDATDVSAEAAARREFREELGVEPPDVLHELGTFRVTRDKNLTVFVGEDTGLDPATCTYGTFEMEWPPRSGRVGVFPEVDRATWVTPERATQLLVPGQRQIIAALR